MKEDIIKLYNTLLLVETRGESTKIMGQCLQFIEQLVQKIDNSVNPKGAISTEEVTT